VEWFAICKLNCPPSLASIFPVAGGAFISKFDTNLAFTSPMIGIASMIPRQLRLPTPNGRKRSENRPFLTTDSVSRSSSKNRSGRNYDGFSYQSGLLASHHALTTTFDSLGMVKPPSFASSRFIRGTNKGIGACIVSFIVAC